MTPTETEREADRRTVAAYATKEVTFKYRGIDLHLSLSHGLFSSADIDSGTRLLLKAYSARLDADIAAGNPLPRSVLDAGSGIGVIGIAAARAIAAAGGTPRIRAQDRDELARAFGSVNAARNGLDDSSFEGRAEPLLSDPPEGGWDLILSNLPAKTGGTVLSDFFARSSRLLAPGGRCMVVIVAPLAAESRRWMEEAGIDFIEDAATAEHAVFSYPRPAGEPERSEAHASIGAHASTDPYARGSARFEWDGVPFRIQAVHGVGDFDEPGRCYTLAAKLLGKLGLAEALSPAGCASSSILIHEPNQGHFAAYLAALARKAERAPDRIVLCGRNVLALKAAAKNAAAALSTPETRVETIPAADLAISAGTAGGRLGRFSLLASFPEIVPRVDRTAAAWESAAELVAPGGLFIIALTSSDATRFDKAKTPAFARAGDLKRDGWRALAYRRIESR